MAFGGKEGSHLVSFLLGAALPTALLFFLASDRLGEGFSTSISLSWGSGGTPGQAAHQEAGYTSSTHDYQQVGFAGLSELLPRVAMEDRTVILTLVNEAWAQPGSLLDIYRESFKHGEGIEHLLGHVLVVAVDAGAFARCKAVHPHCYLLEVDSASLSSASPLMSKEFMELVWLKLSFQQRILELGYNFLFTDADMIWFRNPFRHISVYADISLSTDLFRDALAPLNNELNTGFYYVRATNRSVQMMRRWRAARERLPGATEQRAFNTIKRELAGEEQGRIEALDTVYFSGFCERHGDPGRVCTMHANCCIGLANKVGDLSAMAADWRNYTALVQEERKKGSFKWTPPARCWKTMGWKV